MFPLLVFFSHRWVRPIEGFPDGPDNAKARALIHWAKQELWEQRKKTEVLVRFVLTTWNREVERGDIWKMVVAKVSLLIYLVIVLVAWAVGDWGVCWYIILVILVMGALMNVGARNEVCRKAATKLTGHHAREVEDEVASFIALLPTEVLFFIDYTCVDQENPSAEVGAIPAYVSSCSEILTHFDEMYAQRAWCRAEMMLAYAFTGELDRETFQKKVHMMEFEERKRADEEALERGVLCPVNQCSSNCSHMCKGYEGGNWISVVQSGVQPGSHANWSEEIPLLDPTEGHVTDITDMPVITRLKQCAVTSSSFTWEAAYQDHLSRSINGIMLWFQATNVKWFPNDRCWNVYENICQVIGLPIRVAVWVFLIPLSLVFFIFLIPLTACMALSGKRPIKVGKTRLSLRDRHTYQWGYHPWGEGPVEHVHVAAQTFRFEIPPGSVPGQTMSVKVPMGFAQSWQTRVIIVPPLSQAFVDVPLDVPDGLPDQPPPAHGALVRQVR